MLVIVEIVCGVGFAFGSYFLKIRGIIIYSSFIGAYLIVRACSWFIGGYPNEFTIYQ